MPQVPYILIDTNIFIQCCVLELEKGDDLSVLQKLNTLQAAEKLNILLPEVVELEFYRRLDKKVEMVKRHIADYKKQIGKDSNLDEKVKADMISKIGECLEEREKNAEVVKTEIEKIFKSKSTIKLPITADDLVNALKCSLREDKPYSSGVGFNIQPDVLIVEAARKYFKDKQGYTFYLCSNNKSDFAEATSKDSEKITIAPAIKDGFEHLEYYPNLLQLLNDKFKAGYASKDIKDFSKVKEDLKNPPLVLNIPENISAEFWDALGLILRNCEAGSRKVAIKFMGSTIGTSFSIHDDEKSLANLKTNILKALEENQKGVSENDSLPF